MRKPHRSWTGCGAVRRLLAGLRYSVPHRLPCVLISLLARVGLLPAGAPATCRLAGPRPPAALAKWRLYAKV